MVASDRKRASIWLKTVVCAGAHKQVQAWVCPTFPYVPLFAGSSEHNILPAANPAQSEFAFPRKRRSRTEACRPGWGSGAHPRANPPAAPTQQVCGLGGTGVMYQGDIGRWKEGGRAGGIPSGRTAGGFSSQTTRDTGLRPIQYLPQAPVVTWFPTADRKALWVWGEDRAVVPGKPAHQ